MNMQSIQLSDHEFRSFQQMIFAIAGISMTPAKKQLVGGRLAKRVKHHGMGSYGDYFRLLMKPDARAELQIAVDLLTTNETYFFREPAHFDFLRDKALPELAGKGALRVWSGACSSGEEPYSLAMVMADRLKGAAWEIIASDICTRVLDKARLGHYPMERAEDIPVPLLSRFCLKGVQEQQGTFLVDRQLRERIAFLQVNLNADLPPLGEFDIIFLRNVLIYFDMETKRQVLARMLPLLRKGGYFIVSHSESLHGVTGELQMVSPSIYRKP